MQAVRPLLFLILIVAVSCTKDANRKLLGAYFKYEVNGQKILIEDGALLNDTPFECTIKGDTALYITVARLYEGAGFMVKANKIEDGSYTLSNSNRAYYSNPKDAKRYYTNTVYTGTLSIKKNTFQAKSALNTLEGQFSFQAIDTLTKKIFTITNGAFVMERKHM